MSQKFPFKNILHAQICDDTVGQIQQLNLNPCHIVLINRNLKKILLLEISISFEKNIDSANSRKILHYLNLASGLRNQGWETDNVPIEVGSRGQITKRNKLSISDITRNTFTPKVMNDFSRKIILMYIVKRCRII